MGRFLGCKRPDSQEGGNRRVSTNGKAKQRPSGPPEAARSLALISVKRPEAEPQRRLMACRLATSLADLGVRHLRARAGCHPTEEAAMKARGRPSYPQVPHHPCYRALPHLSEPICSASLAARPQTRP